MIVVIYYKAIQFDIVNEFVLFKDFEKINRRNELPNWHDSETVNEHKMYTEVRKMNK